MMTIPEARTDQWFLVQRCMEEAGIVGYQRSLVCRIFEEECCAAALDWIKTVGEVSDAVPKV